MRGILKVVINIFDQINAERIISKMSNNCIYRPGVCIVQGCNRMEGGWYQSPYLERGCGINGFRQPPPPAPTPSRIIYRRIWGVDDLTSPPPLIRSWSWKYIKIFLLLYILICLCLVLQLKSFHFKTLGAHQITI